ncbi:unnamed protein product [Gordionus sp. m RMFG-2023]|uniref:phosphatidate cytidylyltransferase, photoreceptor-specific-like n=1 Tax=Gordionus sp. m RMFG-2023 TaxID=3053472 RepID=UPI0030E2A988
MTDVDVRKRNIPYDENLKDLHHVSGDQNFTDSNKDDDEDDDEKIIQDVDAEKLKLLLGQASDNTTDVLDKSLNKLSPKWKNYVVRGIFSFLMISTFCLVIYLGPLALLILIQIIQLKCFAEIISIGYAVYRIDKLPWFRTVSWYFLITSNYYFYGESMVEYFGTLVNRRFNFLSFLITYHRFISFTLYIIGFVLFVLSLKKKFYMKQFSLFAWTHVTLMIIVIQSHLLVQNIFEGLIWFIVPVSIIVCNDIGAYLFGFFFGRTPLIQLSPKKTWEGFWGGLVSTLIFGWIISGLLCRYKYMVCPIEYNEKKDTFSIDCIPGPVFQPRLIPYQSSMTHFFRLFNIPIDKLAIYPFQLHSLSMSLFGSVIGPFGGFFASGFKRAFKIKDFGGMIPGHGGVMDRFDCQVLMATFVHVYYSSFIKLPNIEKILHHIFLLKPDQQLAIFSEIKQRLINNHLLPDIPKSHNHSFT